MKPRTVVHGDEATTKLGINPTVPRSHLVTTLKMDFPAAPAATVEDRTCKLTMTFGETEIIAKAVVVKTGAEASVTFSFLPTGGMGADVAAGIGGAGAGGGGDAGGRSVTPAPVHRMGSAT